MNKYLLSISLIIWSVSAILKNYGVLSGISMEMLSGIILSAYGLSAANLAFKNRNRKILALSSTLFLIGIVFLVKSHFEIFELRGLVFTSIFFISGSVLIILFIENTTQKIFLYAGSLILMVGIITIRYFKELGLLNLISKAAYFLEIFWPVILIILGISILTFKKK